MLKTIFAATVGVVLALPAHAVNVNWTDWTAQPGPQTVVGTILDGITPVGVTFTTTGSLNPAPQLNGGTDYWTPRDESRSPYTNVGPNPVDNIPTGTDIVRLSTGGTHTLTFDRAISDIYLSFVSLNNNAWTFSTQALLLSVGGMNIDGNGVDAPGFWGSSSNTAITTPNPGEWRLSGGGEPHGTLLLPGTFTSLSWLGGSESWHGFTIGVEGVATPRVPLPAAGWLAIAGLGALGGLKRLRRR